MLRWRAPSRGHLTGRKNEPILVRTFGVGSAGTESLRPGKRARIGQLLLRKEHTGYGLNGGVRQRNLNTDMTLGSTYIVL